MRRVVRALCWLVLGTLVIALSAVTGVWLTLRASLPKLDGRAAVPGLQANVEIARDALGVPTVVASNRLDGARAMGFLHAQERFFQMDLMRRQSAGELSELFGPALVGDDEAVRIHQLRRAARQSLERLPAHHRAVLAAYTAGVNAGIAALGARPPEYLLLRQSPRPWLEEDSLLVGFAMYLTLQDAAGREERDRHAVLQELPAAAAEFFFPSTTQWDAPLDDSPSILPPIPGPDVLDLRQNDTAAAGNPRENRHSLPPPSRSDSALAQDRDSRVFFEPSLKPGSNSWGVPGTDSSTGSAIIANDMHLGLGIPNIWFRLYMKWHDADTGDPGGSHEWIGATLPGVPALIVGSNRRIAWGFTNATIDTSDLVEIEFDPDQPERYRGPDGWRSIEWAVEQIRVHGESPRTLRIAQTVWGPVPYATTNRLGGLAIRWVAHLPGAIDMRLLDLETAKSVDEALTIAATCGTPVQNFLVGDRKGRLAWALIGPVPQRIGFSGERPVSWADGTRRWDGFRAPTQRPSPYPANEPRRLWTANNRILGSADYLATGSWNTDLGARARQIRDDLRALPKPVRESDLMSIHRDDRAVFLQRWRDRLLPLIGQAPESVLPRDQRQDWIRALEDWEGRASTNSVGYRVTRSFRYQVHERIMEPIVLRCRKTHPGLGPIHHRNEDAVWRLLEERPVHLLNPRFRSYADLEMDALKEVVESLRTTSPVLQQATWGRRNRVHLQHPISRAVPALSRWLDTEPRLLPGDDHMPRVQGPSFGASERLVVSPGYEEAGFFQMPGGQSGHFLSPYYQAGHEDWCQVNPTPLMPGPAQHHLSLFPAR